MFTFRYLNFLTQIRELVATEVARLQVMLLRFDIMPTIENQVAEKAAEEATKAAKKAEDAEKKAAAEKKIKETQPSWASRLRNNTPGW
jgi:hypothetical protein